MRIAINDFISNRGTSGSAVGGSAISNALRVAGYNCEVISPPSYAAGRRLRNAAEMLSWDFQGASRLARNRQASVLINLANTGLGWSIPTINVLHDTMVLDHPALFDRGYHAYAMATFGPSVRAADVNVVPSVHSKKQALQRWPRAKFQVIPWTSKLERVSSPNECWESLNIVSIASADRHKRLPMLVKAVANVRRLTGLDFTLTLVARSGNDEEVLAGVVSQEGREWVNHRTHYLPGSELLQLIDSAFCLAASAVDEGFCIPLLEACRRGIPVVHTGRGAMCEVIEPNHTLKQPSQPTQDLDFLIAQLISLVNRKVWRDEAFRSWERSIKFNSADFNTAWAKLIEETIDDHIA